MQTRLSIWSVSNGTWISVRELMWDETVALPGPIQTALPLIRDYLHERKSAGSKIELKFDVPKREEGEPLSKEEQRLVLAETKEFIG